MQSPLLKNNGPLPPARCSKTLPSMLRGLKSGRLFVSSRITDWEGGNFGLAGTLTELSALGFQKIFLGFSSHPIGLRVDLKTHREVQLKQLSLVLSLLSPKSHY